MPTAALLLALAVTACGTPMDASRVPPASPQSGVQSVESFASTEGGPNLEERLRAFLAAPAPVLGAITEAEFAVLRTFYAARGYAPLWVGAAGLEPSGDALWSSLAAARSAGLAAAGPLLEAAERAAQGPLSSATAELELLLSAALLRAAIDPRDPGSAGQRSATLNAAASTSDIQGFLRNVLPVAPGFWRLRDALQVYRGIDAKGGWPTLPQGEKLELGIVDPRVALLRERLRVTGDLGTTGPRPDVFDISLDAAVRRFQSRHGLLVDGIVGANTLAVLNVPVQERISTIELNLERLRQRDWGQRYIAVNAAAASYRLVDSRRQLFERAAVVGRAGWPTPQLDGMIDRLEFNPYWTVPPRIAKLEVLPKIRSDPDYLRRNDMRWVGGQLRQDPGPANPLGKVKFLFLNPYDVYLHDTNNPGLFERPDRHRSHGCVRVSGALDLAKHLLMDDPLWPPWRIKETLRTGDTVRVYLARPVALHIVYDTAWVDAAGIVNLRGDVYGRDRHFVTVAAQKPDGVDAGCGAYAPEAVPMDRPDSPTRTR